MANYFKIKHGFVSTGDGSITGTLDVSAGININGAAVATKSWVSGQGFATSGSVSGNYLALSGGTLTGVVTAGAGLNIENSSTNLSQKNSAGQLRITTAHGYINIGPANSGWAHFETDRGQFYFNERAEIAGEFVPYTGSTHNLGTSSKPWLAVYADNLNISNWDTAYSWGNHASAGYLTSVPSEYLTQTEGDARYLRLTGGTLTGNINANGSILGDGNLFLRSYNNDPKGIFFRDGFEYGDTNQFNLSITIHDDGDGAADGMNINAYDGVFFNVASGTTPNTKFRVLNTEVKAFVNLVSTGNVYASGGNSTEWNTAYGWGDHAAAGYAASSHNHDSRYYTESEIDTKLAAKADTSHKYHRFNNGDEYYDSYGQDNYLRMFTETATFDTFRFRSYSNVEYWDGSTWQAWGANLDTWFDGREDTGFNLDHTHSHFRFEINRSSGWPTMALFVIQSSWSDTNSHTCEVTLETWDGAAWVIKDQWVYSNFQRGINLHATNQTHDGISSMRVTLNMDWGDASHDYYPMRRILFLSNFSGGETLDPWSWNYNKVVNFDALPQAAGANLATQSWVSSQGYVSSLSGYATESYVNTAVSNLVDSAPGTLDTLNELAAALGDDPNFATTVTNSIATKLSLSGGTMTGNIVFNDDNEGIEFYSSNSLKKVAGTGMVLEVDSTRTNDLVLQIKRGTDYYYMWHSGHFTSTNVSNWNTAYSWGNHSGLYDLAGSASTAEANAIAHADDRIDNEVIPMFAGYQPAGNYFTDGDTVLNMANNDGLVYNDTNNLMYIKADGTDYAIIDSRGGTITGTLTLSGSGTKLALNNGDITGVNQITINDPGEGIVWTSGASGSISLATIDDATDNILNVSGTGASLAVNGATVATQAWVASQGYVTSSGSNYYLSGASFNTGNGILTLTVTGASNVTVDLDGRFALGTDLAGVNDRIDNEVLPIIQTPAITSNGSTPSLNSGITAAEVRSLIGAQAAGSYLTSYTESDTLETVTGRGNTTAGDINVKGDILLTGGATTTNQARTIDFTGFDKEGTTDYSDRAYIQHTTGTGGHSGSVLVISSQNDANDGIAFLTNASSKLKHNSNNIATENWVTSQSYLTTTGKAADSNLLDGLDLHTGRNNEANKVVRTDANGYIQAGWINTPSGAAGTINKIYCSQDDYVRYLTPANFRAQVTDGVYQPAGSYLTTSGKAADSNLLDGLDSSAFLRSNAADTASGHITFSAGISTLSINDTSGQQLVICAGEAGIDASQTGELVYVNAENGFQVAASNDNWATGYAGTKKTIIDYGGIRYDGNYVWHAGNFNPANYQPAGTYNTIIGTDSDINTSGATIIDNIYVTDGVITSMGTRVLTQADLGIPTNVSGNWWNGGYAAVGTDGVMEVGKYIDFHDTDTQTSDFSYRITNTGGRLYFSGDLEIDGGDLYLNDGNTRLHEAGGNALKVSTDSGYIEMGPMNTSHCHIQTDRSNFYFNTEIRVDTGIIGSYNEDLQLRRSNTTKITVGSSLTTFANHISVPQPEPPVFSAANIVGETIEVVFDQSPTSGVDYYQVWSSAAGGAYGMIAQIPTQDIAATMTAIDADFAISGTHAYRVYAIKNGVYSDPAEGSVNFSTPTLDVLNMSVVNLNTAYYIQYDMPDSRFVDHVEIYMDAEVNSANLTRTGATLIYSGNNTSYMYQIGASDLDKFHQFWVEVVES